MSEVSLHPLRVAMMKRVGRSDAGTLCWCALLFFCGMHLRQMELLYGDSYATRLMIVE